MLARVFRVMLVLTSRVPTKVVSVPSVAELPTCQYTPQGPPLIRATLEPVAVVSVLPTLKMKTAFGSPPPSSVSVPVSCADEVKQYTPGVRVLPPRSPVRVDVQGCPAAVVEAVTRSDLAWTATASSTCVAPSTLPGGNPVTELPGASPRSPVITLGPVFVIVLPPRTAKLVSVPRGG
jgi:hypothetical protein